MSILIHIFVLFVMTLLFKPFICISLLGNWSYMHTQRRRDVNTQVIEVKRQITHRDYIVSLIYCNKIFILN